MKFLSTSFSLVPLPDPSQNFRLFPDFPTGCGEPVRIIISESYFTEDSQKKKQQKNGIGGSFFGCLERLMSPRCYKRLPIRRLEVASRK